MIKIKKAYRTVSLLILSCIKNLHNIHPAYRKGLVKMMMDMM